MCQRDHKKDLYLKIKSLRGYTFNLKIINLPNLLLNYKTIIGPKSHRIEMIVLGEYNWF